MADHLVNTYGMRAVDVCELAKPSGASLLTSHCSLLTARYSLSTTRYSLLATRYSLLATHHSPLTTHHSPLTTHHSPLTTHHSPLTIKVTRTSLLALYSDSKLAEDLLGERSAWHGEW